MFSSLTDSPTRLQKTLETGHQLEADTISFGATLSVCKKAQEWQWAMCLLKDAQRRLVPLFLGQFDGFWWVSLGRKKGWDDLNGNLKNGEMCLDFKK